jgi:hypothetical protein
MPNALRSFANISTNCGCDPTVAARTMLIPQFAQSAALDVEIVEDFDMVGEEADRNDHDAVVPVACSANRIRISGSSQGWLGGPLRL